MAARQILEYPVDDVLKIREAISEFLERSFVLFDHAASLMLRERCLSEWVEFFCAERKKEKFEHSLGSLRGYFPYRSEAAVGALKADPKEFFQYFGRGQLLPGLCRSSGEVFELFTMIADSWISELRSHIPGLRKLELVKSGNQVLRAIKYCCTSAQEYAHQHTDITLFTIHLCADRDGLVLYPESDCEEAVRVPGGSIAIFAGDMLEILTEGRVPAVRHSVENSDCFNSRHSLVFFANPPADFVLRAGLSAGQALEIRLREMKRYDD